MERAKGRQPRSVFLLLGDLYLKHLFTEKLEAAGFDVYGSHRFDQRSIEAIHGSCDALVTSLTGPGVLAGLALVFQFGNILFLTNRNDEPNRDLNDAPLTSCRCLVRHYPDDAEGIVSLVRQCLKRQMRLRKWQHRAEEIIMAGEGSPL